MPAADLASFGDFNLLQLVGRPFVVKLQTKANIFIIGVMVGFIAILVLLSKHVSSEALVALFFGWLFLTFILHLIFIRCPHCDECIIDRSGVGRICRFCGKAY